MDLFKYNGANSGVGRANIGKLITGCKTKTWIERFTESGEFTLTGPLKAQLKEQLPPGTLISHIDSTDIMIVENHEITGSGITVTGRSYDTFLENRYVREGLLGTTAIDKRADLTFAADSAANQLRGLVYDAIGDNEEFVGWDTRMELPWVAVIVSATVAATNVSARSFARVSVYEAMMSLLRETNMGLKVLRPGPWMPLDKYGIQYNPELTGFYIHNGVDRSADVLLSHDRGDIAAADYLWSNKTDKNAVLIASTWFEFMVIKAGTYDGYKRRTTFVDASDIDSGWSTAPTSFDKTWVIVQMQNRANSILNMRVPTALTKVETSKKGKTFNYREDYDIGDRIMVQAEYGEKAKMQVVEYVEIEDETGETGYPTLQLI